MKTVSLQFTWIPVSVCKRLISHSVPMPTWCLKASFQWSLPVQTLLAIQKMAANRKIVWAQIKRMITRLCACTHYCPCCPALFALALFLSCLWLDWVENNCHPQTSQQRMRAEEMGNLKRYTSSKGVWVPRLHGGGSRLRDLLPSRRSWLRGMSESALPAVWTCNPAHFSSCGKLPLSG